MAFLADRAILVLHDGGAELRLETCGEEGLVVEDLGWIDRGREETIGTLELRVEDLLAERGVFCHQWRAVGETVRVARLRRR